MPSLVEDILGRARRRRTQPVPLDWFLGRINAARSGIGALEFEHEITDAAHELRRALGEGAHRESLTILVMLVRMVRSAIEQRGELELGPVNGEAVHALARSTEELDWIHERDDSGADRADVIAVLLDEALVADTERAAGAEDPRIEEYWQAVNEVFLQNDTVSDDELPSWPEDLDPAVLRPGMALGFLCAAHAWVLAALLCALSSSERRPEHVELGYLGPLARALELLRKLDAAHERRVRERRASADTEDYALDEVLDALARERQSLEHVVAAFLRTLYGFEGIDSFPPPWLEAATGAASGPGASDDGPNEPAVLLASRDITRAFASQDLAGAVESLARACGAAADMLSPDGDVHWHRYSVIADELRLRACDLAWGVNRIRRRTGTAAALAEVTRFRRHQDDMADNSRGSPFAWATNAYRLMTEDHLLAIACALSPGLAGDLGVSPERGHVIGVRKRYSVGLLLSRARAMLCWYDGALSPDGRDGRWGGGEGANIVDGLEHLASARERLARVIDRMVEDENRDLSPLTEGRVLWCDAMVAIPRLTPTPDLETVRAEASMEGMHPNTIILDDGSGRQYYVYARFIDRALDIIEEHGDEIQVLGSSDAGELVLEVNRRVVTVHHNLDYYSCSCEDAHYRSGEDRHLCKHEVVAAILLGDFYLREEQHQHRAEELSASLGAIRERVLTEREGIAEHLRNMVLNQLEEPTDTREQEVRELELRERRHTLQRRILVVQQMYAEIPPHQHHRRRQLRMELDRHNQDLASIVMELDSLRQVPRDRAPHEQRMGGRLMQQNELQERRGMLAMRIAELDDAIASVRARSHEFEARVMDARERDEYHDLIHRRMQMQNMRRELRHEMSHIDHQLSGPSGHDLNGSDSVITVTPGQWECAPPGEGG